MIEAIVDGWPGQAEGRAGQGSRSTGRPRARPSGTAQPEEGYSAVLDGFLEPLSSGSPRQGGLDCHGVNST